MGMSHKAPPSTYQRHFWITDHACDRFRTRLPVEVGKLGNGTAHRSNDDLGNCIDLLVRSAFDKKKITHIWDDGERAILADIRATENSNDLWAIVKRNTNHRTEKKLPQAVVTLLYNSMVEDSHKVGKWKDRAAEAVSTLRTIAPAEEVKMQEEQLVKPLSSPRKSILIRYSNNGTGECKYKEWADVESAEKFLNELRRDPGVDTSSIRVFSEAVTEAKIIL